MWTIDDWIPRRKRLPPEFKNVLTCNEANLSDPRTGWLVHGCWQIDGCPIPLPLKAVSHWMPLPPKPAPKH